MYDSKIRYLKEVLEGFRVKDYVTTLYYITVVFLQFEIQKSLEDLSVQYDILLSGLYEDLQPPLW